MTADEVILRRQRDAENGETFAEPPPRLRGQSTYLALLSSLATDLDIMLNDLRSSPSTRLLPPSHLHHQQPSPLTVGGGGSRDDDGGGGGVHTSNVYLGSGYRSGQQSQQQQARATTATTTTNTTTSQFNRQQQQQQQQQQRGSSRSQNLNRNQNQSHQQQQQQCLNQDFSRLRESHPNGGGVVVGGGSGGSGDSGNVAITGSDAHTLAHEHVCSGLSPDVRQIQKLPLWSYQQKQLQQPQKLHVQLLQQHQKATKAIATQITLAAETCSTTTTNSSSSTKTTNSSSSTKTTMTNSSSSSSYMSASDGSSNNNNRNSSWLQAATSMLSGSRDKDSQWSSNDSQTTSAATTTNAATFSSSQQQQQQNQLKSSSSLSATTTTTTNANPSATNGNANVNSNNNNNNGRRLPFCGLDSIKGSDNNGGQNTQQQQQQQQYGQQQHGQQQHGQQHHGGTTNLSFDLNSIVGSNAAMPSLDTHSEQFHSLDANDSSCCGDGQFEDDMQALLPPKCRLSRDELSPSRTSLVSSSDGGILAAGETSSETSQGSDECPPCDLGLVERLLLTHPVWFLPGIQRSGAVHFLQGKEEGNFIVRGSSQPNTMAVSVRLPPDTGPYIEHYLIQSNEGVLSLESSRFKFDSIPSLIAHYAQCCDELPVQLVLPRALREARNRQQLSSLALLGQEFWRYPMSCPKQGEGAETSLLLLDAKSPQSNSLTETTSGIGTTVFSNSSAQQQPSSASMAGAKLFSPTAAHQHLGGGLFSQAGTPSDTTSSMSSFTTSGGQHMQLLSPESVDSVILTMSPVDHNGQRGLNGVGMGVGVGVAGPPSDLPSLLSTFKAGHPGQVRLAESGNGIRPQRPTPPNTLNLDLRKPPAPPLRWSKPLTPGSPSDGHPLNGANNFTVTTTVTFSVDNNNGGQNSSNNINNMNNMNMNSQPQFVEVTTPSSNAHLNSAAATTTTFQTFAKRLSPEGECKDTMSSQGSSSTAGSRWHSGQSSKDSSSHSQRRILSPGTPVDPASNHNNKSRKSKARKESKHYQESDILESPQIYCRSALADKFSDYEDLWTQDPSERAALLTSFKPAPPEGVQGKRPDLLAETPSVASLSPANAPPPGDPATATPTGDAPADSQQLIQLSDQPRSRAGLLLPGLMSQSLNEDQLKTATNGAATNPMATSEGETTPTPTGPAQTPVSRSKQGSPFYAEPADALRQAGLTASILRRSHRGALLPANHRHSEPPKGGVARAPLCPLMLMPGEIEKIAAGSLDELKKKQQSTTATANEKQQQNQPRQPRKRARGRFEQWQLDSSWEFMGNGDEDDDDDEKNEDDDDDDNYGDYDSAEHWKQAPPPPTTSQEEKENDCNRENKEKPITIHQIIAKRLPDLNLPELVRCSTPQQQQPHQQNGSQKSIDSQTGCRLSSYDNVERNLSFFNGIDSSQSDDGTVFSEPWDPSQWDSLMPQDDTTLTSDSIHLSKCRPLVSEDDTIIEELSTKEHNNQDTLKARKTHQRQKVATILRNPSIRDREILCHPRNKINPYGAGPGDSVRAYTLQLAQDQSSTFARNIENFISCTKESREAAPQVVMRNMRQFMNGMKNYLVKHGEGKFQQEVESARARLKSDEFLNLDAILETVMHQLVVLPLREHLYGMFVDYYTRSEDIQLLAQNVKYACGRSAGDFGIRATVTPPTPNSLHVISNLLLRLQEAELPLEKLDLFLCVISTIFDATGCPRGQQLGADDFLPILVYVVAKCGFVGAEIEAEFMWGLLQPTLLNGEPGYYLTALCSAVHVLKSFMASENESGTGSLDWRASSLPACSSVLRVIIPDECNGSLQTRTLPVRPHTTTREVCRIIAHKARITNPQDYALFKLVDGEETPLSETECPQDIRLATKGKHCMLAYKRIDAKIAWPTSTHPVYN